jgi:glycosyltransferase 2 family protein
MTTADAEVAIVEQSSTSVGRSPTDALRLAVAVAVFALLVTLGLFFDEAVVGFTQDILRGLDALPEWVLVVVGIAARLLGLVVVGGGLAHAVIHGRWRLLVTLLLAAVASAALFGLVDPWIDHTESSVTDLETDVSVIGHPEFPTAWGVAVLAAAVTAAAPWVKRRWRRAGWALVFLVAGARFLIAPVSFDSALAVASGWVGGALAVVVLGSPLRRPSGHDVVDGLGAVGLPLAHLEQASVDARGSTPYFGETSDGRSVFVKALGADERSADLLFRLYRWVQPRDLGDEKPFSSLRRAVEHEALVSLAARDVGITTPRLVAFATAPPDAFVLAYEAIEGRSFDRLRPEEVTDGVLDAVWAQVNDLRVRRIAHRDLRLANIFLADDGEAWIIDFGFSELAASDLLLATDLAELLASSALQVGVERAVAAAVRAVAVGSLIAAVPRLELRYLSGATRTALKEAGLLPALRAELAGAGRGNVLPSTAVPGS